MRGGFDKNFLREFLLSQCKCIISDNNVSKISENTLKNGYHEARSKGTLKVTPSQTFYCIFSNILEVASFCYYISTTSSE